MDIFEKAYNFKRADEAIEQGLYPYFRKIDEVYGNKVRIGEKEYIMVGSNNYMGLIGDPRIEEAMVSAIKRYGSSTCGSRFLNGTLAIHVELEEKLAEFMGKEAALAFSTGYQTNLGILSAIAGKNDVIIMDRWNHASLFDATRLSFAKVYKYKHNDMEDLERLLKSLPEDVGKIIVVDGVFSMEGDLANIPELVKLKKKYNARLMVDDAHGVGILGENGRGTAEHFGLIDEVDLIMTTFSKAFASLGGFVVGEKKVINYIKHFARPLIFSASITPAQAAAALKALEIIKTEPQRRKRLMEIANYMKEEFNKMGYDTGLTVTPIVPLVIKDDELTFKLWLFLREAGIFVTPVVPPAVPPERSLIRTSYTATHSDEELNAVLKAFYEGGKTLGII